MLFTVLGGALRFIDLGSNPIWIDESLFANWSHSAEFVQEYPTLIIANLFGFQSEFWLRFMFALAGTLTIPAVYFVVKKHKIEASIIVAIFPLFIFWSRMARPYAFAGLFLVLGWRWWYFSIISILTTPFGFLGVRFWKQKTIIILLLTAIALIVYLERPDAGADKPVLIYRTRLLYLPLLTLLLYVTEYEWKWFLIPMKKVAFYVIIFFSLWFFPSHQYRQWYSYEVGYSDWRGKPAYQFSTNAHVNHWYALGITNKPGTCFEIVPRWMPLLVKEINEGKSITLGLDYYALESPAKELLPENLTQKYKARLLKGEVIGLILNKNGYREF